MTRMRTSTTARLAVIWGSSFLWIKLAWRGLSPVEVTFGRLLLGAAMLFVVVAQRSTLPWARVSSDMGMRRSGLGSAIGVPVAMSKGM